MNQQRAKDVTLFLLRVVAGLLFLQAGGMKLLDWFGGVPAQYGGHPKLWSLIWFAGFLELYIHHEGSRGRTSCLSYRVWGFVS